MPAADHHEEWVIAAEPLFVHVGLPKTGTTHVQQAFAANRSLLTGANLLYPGTSAGPQHFRPVLDFLQMRFGPVQKSDVAGLWEEVVTSVQAWPGRALVSHELLAGASPEQVESLVRQFAPRPVHVIVSVRDMSRLLPAVWQERAKNRATEGWTNFRTRVARGADADKPHKFWKLHDVEKVVKTWREQVPTEHIHLVTVPATRSERDLLMERFCSLLGIDFSQLDIAVTRANESIGGLELAALREINAAAHDRLDRATYTAAVKHFIVPRLLAGRDGQVRMVLPESDRQWVEQYTDRIRTLVGSAGLDVVGTLDDLGPASFVPDDPADPRQTGDFPAGDVGRALAEVLVDLIEEGRVFESPSRAGRPGVTPDSAGAEGGSRLTAVRRRLARRRS